MFLVAAVVSLPKQIVLVYVGVALASSAYYLLPGSLSWNELISVNRRLQERQNPAYRHWCNGCHHGYRDGLHTPVDESGTTGGGLCAEEGAPGEAAKDA